MLRQLSIKNFALIDQLKVDFNQGFSIITGETGAGKSILLGALSLILGKRADLSLLKSSDQKCVIEGEFQVGKYGLAGLFKDHDLDYEEESILRREIYPSGKSRAFVNDTPVTLSVLNLLGKKLIDIHSQHETLQLAETKFQFELLDAFANNNSLLKSYREKLREFNEIKNELEFLIEAQTEAKLQYDYNLFLFNELSEAQLKVDEQTSLENTLDKLNNVEAIKQHISEAVALATQEELGLENRLNTLRQLLSKLSSFSSEYTDLLERVSSIAIELNDIVSELERSNESVNLSPDELDSYNARLQLLYDLQKKHGVSSNEELLDIQSNLRLKVDAVENDSALVQAKKDQLEFSKAALQKLADELHQNRLKAIPGFTSSLEEGTQRLSMPNTRFSIEIEQTDVFTSQGQDQLRFLFSANKGVEFEPLKKVASGGEMSRIMLAVKALLSGFTQLPSIIFDEIDTGVSGEVSNKIAAMMQEMSENMQVISITHLPQIAAKGSDHFKVYKEVNNAQTYTNIKKLTKEERIQELAEMLSGKDIAASAIEHARQLLN